MGAAVKINNTDHTAAELRTRAAKSNDADQARRLLAIAMILDSRLNSDLCASDRLWIRRRAVANSPPLSTMQPDSRYRAGL